MKPTWYRSNDGSYRYIKGIRLVSLVVDRNLRTGRGKTIWIALKDNGERVTNEQFVSVQQAKKIVENLIK